MISLTVLWVSKVFYYYGVFADRTIGDGATDIRVAIWGSHMAFALLEHEGMTLFIDVHLDPSAKLPVRATPGASGFDLLYSGTEPLFLWRDEPVAVPTGLRMAIPAGYEGQIRPRSGLATKGVTVANAPGTVDCDYRGEVKVLLVYIGRYDVVQTHFFKLMPGERIAQMVFAPVRTDVSWIAKQAPEELGVTERGEGGFGSTGTGALGEG